MIESRTTLYLKERMTMEKVQYRFPDIDVQRLIYKGRRFWIIELTSEKDSELRNFSKDDGDYVFYDAKWQALYDEGLYAFISKREDGQYLVEPNFTHVDISYEAGSIKEVVSTLPEIVDDYCKAVCG